MWEWYGDKHRGYCVQVHNLPFGKAIREVVYTDEPIRINWTEIESNIDVFFTKHRDWSNEEEVRMLIPRRWGGPSFPFSPVFIDRVILGKDMPGERADLIRGWGRERQPPVAVVSTRWETSEAKLVIVD